MDEADREIMSESFCSQPWGIDAKGVSLARRPRYYWITWELRDSLGVELSPPSTGGALSYGTVTLSGDVPADSYLVPGWRRASDEPFLTFTTSRPRSFPGRKPAGIDKLNETELAQ